MKFITRPWAHPLLIVTRRLSISSKLVNFDILNCYNASFGNLIVPRHFVVSEKLAREFNRLHYTGFELGKYVRQLEFRANSGLFSSQDEERLNKLGLITHRQVMTAAESYVSYGGNAVPPDFVIPENTADGKPYPLSVIGFPLGKVVSRMNDDDKYCGPIRDQLEKLGIVVQLNDGMQYKLLKTFKDIHGHCFVPENYRIAFGDTRFPQAGWQVRLDLVRRRLFYKLPDLSPELRQRYEEDGLLWDRGTQRFNDLMAVLQVFKQIHGHVQVPINFVVPRDSEYPKKSWGKHFGIAMYYVRIRKSFASYQKEFEEMGVEYVKVFGIGEIVTALRAYQRIYGHLKVAEHFVIDPNDRNYPQETHGLRLGAEVRNVKRKNGSHLKEESSKSEDNFNWNEVQIVTDSVANRNEKKRRIVVALSAFKKIHGHVKVPQDFVIPSSDDSYPPDTWGLKLGLLAQRLRLSNTFPEHKSELDAMGFSFGSKTELDYLLIYKALNAFKQLKGHVRVPEGYFVKEGDSAYPEETWGLSLGRSLASIRREGAHPNHRQELEALGVDFNKQLVQFFEFPVILDTLKNYKAVHGDVHIPSDFVVRGAQYGGVNVQGMKLGQIVASMRIHGSFAQHKPVLVELGIDFTVRKVRTFPFELVFECLNIYKKLHGHLRISIGYAVPEGSKVYPTAAWGMKLGARLHDIRFKGTFEAYRKNLESIGVVIKVKEKQRRIDSR